MTPHSGLQMYFRPVADWILHHHPIDCTQSGDLLTRGNHLLAVSFEVNAGKKVNVRCTFFNVKIRILRETNCLR